MWEWERNIVWPCLQQEETNEKFRSVTDLDSILFFLTSDKEAYRASWTLGMRNEQNWLGPNALETDATQYFHMSCPAPLLLQVLPSMLEAACCPQHPHGWYLTADINHPEKIAPAQQGEMQLLQCWVRPDSGYTQVGNWSEELCACLQTVTQLCIWKIPNRLTWRWMEKGTGVFLYRERSLIMGSVEQNNF